MENINSTGKLSSEFTTYSEEEIDVRLIAGALLRHKALILKITVATILLSGFYALTRKPVWEGQFQIVVESQEAGGAAGQRLAQLAANNPLLSNLAGLGASGKSQLQTEVKILESPLVLKPTYDYVKSIKSKSGEDVSNWTFFRWRKENLDIELEKGTSVLNIVYRDTDADIVLPVIQRISRDYQRYSGRGRRRSLSQGVNFLSNQVEDLRVRAKASMREAQVYALANGLGLQDGIPTALNAISMNQLGGYAAASVEASREVAQNRVNSLEQQLLSAKSAGNRSVFQAPQLRANASLFGKLQTLEAELLHKQSLLKPNDDFIRRLDRKRKNLIAYINNQTIGLLEGELVSAKSQLTSLSRPREVVLKHRELVRSALRDETTLGKLEAQLQTLQLEQARQTDPWELITTPTVLDKPVSPRKLRILAIGLLSGLVLGSSSALVINRRSGLVYSEDELKSLLPCPLLKQIPALAGDAWTDAADLLASGPLAEFSGNEAIALIPLGEIPSEQLEAFSAELSRALNKRELIVSTDLRETSHCATQLLITSPGVVTRTLLSEFRQKLSLQGTPVTGWILINPDF